MSLLSFQLPDKIVMEKADDFHGIFTFSPLQPGYGLTIGNAVRRVLLSSLEGYAVTGIKIPGIQHEFSTIDGIVEDVSEIILNLKTIRFKPTNDNPEKNVTVSFDKKGTMTGADISKAAWTTLLTCSTYPPGNALWYSFLCDAGIRIILSSYFL